jgi:hypothetical protein
VAANEKAAIIKPWASRRFTLFNSAIQLSLNDVSPRRRSDASGFGGQVLKTPVTWPTDVARDALQRPGYVIPLGGSTPHPEDW